MQVERAVCRCEAVRTSGSRGGAVLRGRKEHPGHGGWFVHIQVVQKGIRFCHSEGNDESKQEIFQVG
jgi:hypothetical protein